MFSLLYAAYSSNNSFLHTLRVRLKAEAHLTMPARSPPIISPDWYKSPQGKEVIASILNKNTQQRKPFGLLERPIVASSWNLSEFEYKIFLSGRSGVGKTSTAAKLSANDVPLSHCETPGIQTSTVYWPAMVMDQNSVVMFKLQLWDAGENALRKFDHVLPACKNQADALLYMFSFADKSSFDELPQQMSRIQGPEDKNLCQFVLGTKLDLLSCGEVTQHDLSNFEDQWQLPVHSIKNLPSHATEARSEIDDVAYLLNYMCEQLWKRDQAIVDRGEGGQARRV